MYDTGIAWSGDTDQAQIRLRAPPVFLSSPPPSAPPPPPPHHHHHHHHHHHNHPLHLPQIPTAPIPLRFSAPSLPLPTHAHLYPHGPGHWATLL